MIGGGKPEIDGEGRGLHAESEKIHHAERHQRRRLAQSRSLARDVGHVQRAERAVEQPGRDQEQSRGDEVEHRVFGRAIDLFGFRPQDDQAEGRDQEDLEPDIEVEDVAGQERAADTRHHQEQERIETVSAAGRIDVEQRKYGGHQRHQRRRRGQRRAQRIGRERDAERRQPAAHRHHHRALIEHADEKTDIDGQKQRQRRDRDHALGARVVPEHQEHGTGEDRQGNGRDHQPVAERNVCEDHRIGQVHAGGGFDCHGDLSIPAAGVPRPPARRASCLRCRRCPASGRRGSRARAGRRRTRTK